MGRRERRGRVDDVRGQSLGYDLWPASRTLLCSVTGCVCVCVCGGTGIKEKRESHRSYVFMYKLNSSAVTLIIMS